MGVIMDVEKLISGAVDEMAVYKYLTADFGAWFGVYPDGSISVGETVGREIAEDERPVVSVRCPGVENLDESLFTDEYVYMSDDTGAYIEIETGLEVGCIEDVVHICCRDGYTSEYVADLRQRLLDTYEDEEEWNGGR